MAKTIIGFREPVEVAVMDRGGLVRLIERTGIRLANHYVGAGRYRVAYTEGTIID